MSDREILVSLALWRSPLLPSLPNPRSSERAQIGKTPHKTKPALGYSCRPSSPGWSSAPPSPGPLTNGVARCGHSGASPIWRWVKRLLNFGPDDPATESQQRHLSHAPSIPANSSPDLQRSSLQLLSSFLTWLLPALSPHQPLHSSAFPPGSCADPA